MKKNLLVIFTLTQITFINAQTNVLPTNGDVGIGTTAPAAKLDVHGTARIDSTLTVDSVNVLGNTRLGNDLKIDGNLILTNVSAIDPNEIYSTLMVKGDGTVFSTPKATGLDPLQVPLCLADPLTGLPLYTGTNWTYDNPNRTIYTGHCTEAKVGINKWNPSVALDVNGTTRSTRLALGFTNPLSMTEYFAIKINTSPATAYSLMSVKSGVNNLFDLNSSGLLNTKFVEAINVETQKIGVNVDPNSAAQVGFFHLKTNLPNTNTTPVFLLENQTRKLFQVNNNGHIYARQIRVNLDVAWPDYVFKSDYNLMPLKELEKFIQVNGHLPNVQSAADIKENGLDLGESNRILTEKVEELTLYLIEQQKLIEKMQLQIVELNK